MISTMFQEIAGAASGGKMQADTAENWQCSLDAQPYLLQGQMVAPDELNVVVEGQDGQVFQGYAIKIASCHR